MLNFNTTICADGTLEIGSFANEENYLSTNEALNVSKMSFHNHHLAKRTHTVQAKWGKWELHWWRVPHQHSACDACYRSARWPTGRSPVQVHRPGLYDFPQPHVNQQ